MSATEFIDSSVIAALIRWSNEAQLSEREAVAIVVGSVTSVVARTLSLVRVTDRLPVFETVEAARDALLDGQRPRPERAFGWLSHRQLEAARVDALAAASDATAAPEDRDDASVRLGRIVDEQRARRDDEVEGADAGTKRASAEATDEADDNPND